MVRICCFAPNCTSGYNNNKLKVSLFKVPKDKLKLWSTLIPRHDKQLTINDVLCEKHFFKEDVIRERVTETYSYPLKIPRLTENATPSIWPNCPAHLSKKVRNTSDTSEVPSTDSQASTSQECNASTSGNAIFVKTEDGPLVPLADLHECDPSTSVNGIIIKTEDVLLVPSTDPLALTSQECNPSTSVNTIIIETDNQPWLHKLFNELWKNNITLPSESWTIKFHDHIIAIFKTAATEDDIIITKKILFSESYLNFFVFQHLHECLTDKSHNKIDSVDDFQKKLIDFDELSICYGFKTKENFTMDFSKTRYHKDEFAKSIRHKNCRYLLDDRESLRKNIYHCLLCRKAKKAINYLKATAAKTTLSRNDLFIRNSINRRKRLGRMKHTLDKVKKELQEVKEKLKNQNRN